MLCYFKEKLGNWKILWTTTETNRWNTKNEYFVVSGNFEAGMGKIAISDIAGKFGENKIKNNGQKFKHFATCNNLNMICYFL